MSKIYLARHGQDQDNAKGILNGHRDTALTTLGLEQAELLAQKIKEQQIPINMVFSSPLQRAFKTAQAVAQKLNVAEPQALPLLIERDFGVMTGKLVKEIEATCAPEIIKSDPIIYFLSPEDAETFPQLIARAKVLLQWLHDNAADEDVLLVSHGDIGKMIYTAFYDLDWKEVLTGFHFGNSEVLLLAEGTPSEELRVFTFKQHNH